MSEDPTPERAFKGVWIPREIWEAEDITWMEKCLLAEINSLDDGTGCFASNEWLARKFGNSSASVANQISKLRGLGYLETLSFDGRRRRIKVKADLTPQLRLKKPDDEASLNPAVKALYRESKVENKVENPKAPEASPSASLFPDKIESSIKSKMEIMPETPEKKNCKLPTSEPAIAIANLYSRRLTTEWSPKEIKAFKAIGEISMTDLGIIKGYYDFERTKKRHFLRKDLLTFLNNYNGELDRANAWNDKPKAQEKQDKPIF